MFDPRTLKFFLIDRSNIISITSTFRLYILAHALMRIVDYCISEYETSLSVATHTLIQIVYYCVSKYEAHLSEATQSTFKKRLVVSNSIHKLK